MHGYGGWGGDCACDDRRLWVFIQILSFSLIYIDVNNLRQRGFYKQLLVQNELKFNL